MFRCLARVHTLHLGTAVLLVCALTGLAPAVAAAGVPDGGDTPQAVFARAQAAAAANDIGELAACMTPADRAEMTMMMVIATGFMVGMGEMAVDMGGEMGDAFSDDMSDDEKAELEKQKAKALEEAKKLSARYEAILDKHGLKDLLEEDEAMAEPAAGEDPEDALATALEGIDQVALIKDLWAFMEEFGDEPGQPAAIPEGELANLTVDGDTASGTLGEEIMRFVRIDDRWYLKIEEEE